MPALVRRTVLSLSLVLLAAHSAVHGQDPRLNDREVAGKVKDRCSPAVLRLQGFADGKETVFTGFLVEDRVVITVAHGLSKAKTWQAYAKDRSDFIVCKLIDHRSDLDLAAVWLDTALPGRALELFPKNKQPAEGALVVMIGHPLGLTRWYDHGHITAFKTRGQILRELQPAGKVPTEIDGLSVIQHTINSAVGCSGSPVLDANGKVVGVHSDGASNETKLSFCVPHDHIGKLDLKKEPKEMPGPALRSDFDKYFSRHSQNRAVIPATSSAPELDLSCYHRGDVPRDAELIFRNYVGAGNKARFASFVSKPDLEHLLRNHNHLVHVTNPALRFSFLVPCCYKFEQLPFAAPQGVRVRLTLTDAPVVRGVPPEFRTLTITAWKMHRPAEGRNDLDGKDYLNEVLRYGKALRGPEDKARENGFRPLDAVAARAGEDDPDLAGRQLQHLSAHAPERLFGWKVHPQDTIPNLRLGENDVKVDERWTDKKPILVPNRSVGRWQAVYETPPHIGRSKIVLYAVNQDVVVVADFEVHTATWRRVTNAPPGQFLDIPPDMFERMFVVQSLGLY